MLFMRQANKNKLYTLSVLLLGTMVFVNLSFCLALFANAAQAQESFKEPSSEVFKKDISPAKEESCENTAETKTEQGSNTKNKNTVLPCCLDHDKITKIDNAPNFKISDLHLPPVLAISDLDYEAKNQTYSFVRSLDLPPPEPDILFSVFKKE